MICFASIQYKNPLSHQNTLKRTYFKIIKFPILSMIVCMMQYETGFYSLLEGYITPNQISFVQHHFNHMSLHSLVKLQTEWRKLRDSFFSQKWGLPREIILLIGINFASLKWQGLHRLLSLEVILVGSY